MNHSTQPNDCVTVDPTPRFELSHFLYMQFMEPLGTTDGSVEAAWDHLQNTWRTDWIETTQQLSPTMIRWGGCLSSYHRWQEGVGSRSNRTPYHNLLWGGIESHHVGTHELIDFCRQVHADPLIAVNFESDGRKAWAHPVTGGDRSAGPDEAAAWVDYCNHPQNKLRIAHGMPDPYNVHFWQIGNETSYDPQGYDIEITAQRTLAFARAMHQADPSIALIGWGDGGGGNAFIPFAPRVLEVAGEYLNYIAFHHMYDPGQIDPNFDLRHYRCDLARTWDLLMNAYQIHEAKIQQMRQAMTGFSQPLALTESHFTLPGRNRNDLLFS